MGGNLQSKFRDCVANKESASYPFGSRRETLELMSRYARWVEKNGWDLEVSVLKYRDARSAGPRDAVMFSFGVGSQRGQTPVTECQMIFPPHFPRVPPILAVKPTGLLDFENSRHARHPLPTKACEVKLENFFFKNDPDALMLEFVSTITRDFPNTSQKTGMRRQLAWPAAFDERYNDVDTTFPFDFDFKSIVKTLETETPSQRARAEYIADLELLRASFLRLQTQGSPARALEMASNHSVALMREDIGALEATNRRLLRKIGEFEGVAVEDIVTKQQRSEEVECFELESKLLGLRETVGFLEDHFQDDHETDFKEVLGKLMGLYDQEFEAARRAKGVPVARRFFGRAG